MVFSSGANGVLQSVPDDTRRRASAGWTDHTARAEREVLIFGLDRASAVDAFKELRTESQLVEQANFIITNRKPNVR